MAKKTKKSDPSKKGKSIKDKSWWFYYYYDDFYEYYFDYYYDYYDDYDDKEENSYCYSGEVFQEDSAADCYLECLSNEECYYMSFYNGQCALEFYEVPT